MKLFSYIFKEIRTINFLVMLIQTVIQGKQEKIHRADAVRRHVLLKSMVPSILGDRGWPFYSFLYFCTLPLLIFCTDIWRVNGSENRSDQWNVHERPGENMLAFRIKEERPGFLCWPSDFTPKNSNT